MLDPDAPRTLTRTCNLCEAMCGLLVTLEEGRITNIRGNPKDVLSRGHLCPKGPALAEVYDDPDRLRRPVLRTDSGWKELSWDEAYRVAVERLSDVRARHGADSIAVYLGNPGVHNHGIVAWAHGFMGALGTRSRFDANSVDANPKLLTSLWMYGDVTAIPIPDIDRTDLLVMLGANPLVSNGSLFSMGDVKGRFQDLKRRGGRLVVFDPRRTETAEKAEEHHFIRPGGDAALVLAMLQVVVAEGLVARDAVEAMADGLAEVEAACKSFTPERVAGATGVPAEVTRRLARELATTPRAVLYGRVGTSLNPFGTLASWAIDVFNVVTGHLDREGGVMFPNPAVDLSALGKRLGINGWGRFRSRVRGLPELSGNLPLAVMSEEMDTPGPGQLRALVTLAGNPVSSGPNTERLDRAMGGLEFVMAVDYYINETTRHAHLILPPRHALERSHYDPVLLGLSVRDVAKWSEPVVPPDPGGQDDWEILYTLGMRLGGLRTGSRVADLGLRALNAAGVRLSADRLMDLLLRTGPHGLSVKALRKAPNGLDLGPLKPRLPGRLRTANRRVQLAPRALLDDVVRVEAWLAAERPAIVLIGRRHLRDNNSGMHNVPSLAKGRDRATLLMHPADAARLGLVDGARARVQSRVGALEAPVEVTDLVMPGVVSLPHGHGHARCADTLHTAATVPGPNINDVTDAEWVDPLSGVAVLNGTPVDVCVA